MNRINPNSETFKEDCEAINIWFPKEVTKSGTIISCPICRYMQNIKEDIHAGMEYELKCFNCHKTSKCKLN